MHSLLLKSFVPIRSPGMRLAPETLLLEIMRELFYERRSESRANREVDPHRDRDDLSVGERAVLYAMRGRRKKTRRSKTRDFFAPAYPTLARGAWTGQQRERVVANYLWRGPVAQHILGGPTPKTDSLEEISRQLVEALAGDERGTVGPGDITRTQDILYGALPRDRYDGIRSCTDAARHVVRTIQRAEWSVMDIENDDIARRIALDLRSLCRLESLLPRMQWLHSFMTWLRLALAMWLLAHMQVTRLIHGWAVAASSRSTRLETESIKRCLQRRNRGLLLPTITPTRRLLEHIEAYMKCRVELNILLGWLELVNRDAVRNKSLVVADAGGPSLGVPDLLDLLWEAADRLVPAQTTEAVPSERTVRESLTRAGERFAAWRAPLTKGQGKNIDEFFRVLYQTGDPREGGGHLLTQRGTGRQRSFEVFPGPMLLKTLAYCAAAEKTIWAQQGGGGRLILRDLEEIMACYGIDFSAAASARPRLISTLRSLGLLTGSPDAGSSVAIRSPYPWRTAEIQ